MTMRETIRLLRLAATASAVIGFAVNLIALWQVSITRHFGAPLVPRALFAWAFLPLFLCTTANQVILHVKQIFKHGIHHSILIIIDACLFALFLLLLIANGVTINHIGISAYVHLDRVQLLVYNAMPWVLCGGIHLIFTVRALADTLGLKVSKRKTRCDDCKRAMGQTQGKSAADGASTSLLRPDYDSEEDGDANAQDHAPHR